MDRLPKLLRFAIYFFLSLLLVAVLNTILEAVRRAELELSGLERTLTILLLMVVGHLLWVSAGGWGGILWRVFFVAPPLPPEPEEEKEALPEPPDRDSSNSPY